MVLIEIVDHVLPPLHVRYSSLLCKLYGVCSFPLFEPGHIDVPVLRELIHLEHGTEGGYSPVHDLDPVVLCRIVS